MLGVEQQVASAVSVDIVNYRWRQYLRNSMVRGE